MTKFDDNAFASAWRDSGASPSVMANRTGLSPRTIYARRASLEGKGIRLATVPLNGRKTMWSAPHHSIPQRLEVGYPDGVCVVFSDAHYWPDIITPAHKALVKLIGVMNPRLVIANGDVLDGATISRHDPDGWQTRPPLSGELKACIERMGEIEEAAGVDATLVWTMGNHDSRFERHLAINAPQFAGMPGTTLAEHFPRWTHTMSCMVNPHGPNKVMVKHRYANGVHATYNNTVKSGVTMVTGHLHRLNITAWGDYNGRRYGIDTGTLAEPQGPQFTYSEDSPSPHGQGFAVLTFEGGYLLPPELVEVRDGTAYFRGKSI